MVRIGLPKISTVKKQTNKQNNSTNTNKKTLPVLLFGFYYMDKFSCFYPFVVKLPPLARVLTLGYFHSCVVTQFIDVAVLVTWFQGTSFITTQ